MTRVRCCAFAALLSLCGCVHVSENAQTASISQIETHVAPVVGSTTLHLTPIDHHHFTGRGTNRTGEFVIEVTREDNNIAFQGTYLPPAKGGFSGSTSWSNERTAHFGLKRTSASASTTLSTH